MGQAKNRGSFEQRQAAAVQRQLLADLERQQGRSRSTSPTQLATLVAVAAAAADYRATALPEHPAGRKGRR